MKVMRLDKETREAVLATVRKATVEIQETYQEQWITGEQLCELIPFFSKDWLKRYGMMLPRECVRVMDEQGRQHKTGWCYPKKKILRMVNEGKLRMLRMDLSCADSAVYVTGG